MKTQLVTGIATLACLVAMAQSAAAEQSRYTCRAGAVTITSLTPCYVTTYGVSVPGGGSIDKEGQEGKEGGGKKGGGFNGPKDLKDKPKGGGFKGPKDIKDKD